MIHKILEDGCDSNGGDVPQKPQAVIIAPTRELAIQIKVIYSWVLSSGWYGFYFDLLDGIHKQFQ